MPTDVINEVALHYVVLGTGDPLVLVHGSWGDHHDWDALAPLLADEFQVVAFDRRGHSASASPAGQGTVNDDVADLAALIRHVGNGPAHVVGNSFGGSIALRLAAQNPGLIRTVSAHEPPLMTLLTNDPAAGPFVAGFGERMGVVIALLTSGQNEAAAREFVEKIALGPAQWDLLPPPARQTFVRNAGTFLDEANDPDALTVEVTTLSNYKGPVLLTQGDASPPFFAMILDTVAPALAGTKRATLEGAGHVPQMSHPKEYAEILAEHLRG
ncbi:MAG: alpha/beta hydrolase [Candidatus Dormibacteraeota bacterium]|uniref:Alpha/beta hydrolase n=1 Tax=Candidatus Aeolococcus gillhamiae TaxID=3127015 RepID=A0A934K5U6_9BACT|nr:alpha/beta hydrolase [Candidatus Dormibacteraeota bacterium]